MNSRLLNRFFVFVASFFLLLNSLFTPLSVAYAQEVPAPTSEETSVPSLTDGSTVTPTPTSVTEDTSSSTPSSDLTIVPAPEVAATPSSDPIVEPTETPEITTTPTEIAAPVWKDNPDGSITTINPVGENVEYHYKDTEVKVVFTKLTTPGHLTIKEIQLSDDEKVKIGALTNTAYDISSDMQNGTFLYDLTLPNPNQDQNVTVKYSEDGSNFSTTPSEIQNTTVLIRNLDHFTTFVVVSNLTPPPTTYLSGVIDNSDPEYSEIGSWSNTSCTANAYNHTGRYATNSGSKTATWHITVPQTGHYKVYFSWIKYSTQASNASYTINFEGGSSNIHINQGGTNCAWSNFVLQGSYLFNAGVTYSVVLSNAGADGNVFADAIKVIGGDDIAPAVPIHISPADNSFATTMSLTSIDWSDVSDPDGPVTYFYESSHTNSLNPDGSFVLPVYTSDVLSSSQIATTGTSEGVYFWHVRSQDSLGNKSAWSSPWKVTVDNTSPTVDLVFPVPGPSATSFQAVFSENVSQADAENPANYFLHNWPGAGGTGNLVGHADISYNSETYTATVTFTTPGWYISPEQEWGVENVHDLAGNIQTTNPYSEFSTPMIAPSVPGSPSTSPSLTNSTTQNWTWSSSTDNPGGSGIKGYYQRVYDVLSSSYLSDWNWIGNVLSTTTNLGEGEWQLHIKAEDNAGNIGSESWGSVKVDTTKPVTTFNSPDAGSYYNGPITISGNSNDGPHADTVVSTELFYKLHGSDADWQSIATLTTEGPDPFLWTYNWTPSSDGVYDIMAQATDDAGNVEDGVIVENVTYDTTKPTGSWISPTDEQTVSGLVHLNFNADDNLSGVATLNYSYSSDGINFVDIGSSDWDTTGLHLGNYTLRATVTDKAGNSKDFDEIVGVSAIISGESGVGTSHTTATITWTTDRPASSRVVYDTVSHGSLDFGDANYGYAFSTGTSDTSPEVLSHSVTIAGLSAGTFYYYRVISAGSPVAVGDNHSFATLSVAGAPAPGPWNGVLGTSTQFGGLLSSNWVLGELFGTREGEVLAAETASPSPTPSISPVVAQVAGQTGFLFFITHNKKLILLILAVVVVAILLLRRFLNKNR